MSVFLLQLTLPGRGPPMIARRSSCTGQKCIFLLLRFYAVEPSIHALPTSFHQLRRRNSRPFAQELLQVNILHSCDMWHIMSGHKTQNTGGIENTVSGSSQQGTLLFLYFFQLGIRTRKCKISTGKLFKCFVFGRKKKLVQCERENTLFALLSAVLVLFDF